MLFKNTAPYFLISDHSLLLFKARLNIAKSCSVIQLMVDGVHGHMDHVVRHVVEEHKH